MRNRDLRDGYSASIKQGGRFAYGRITLSTARGERRGWRSTAGARRQIHDKLIAIWCVAEESIAQPDQDQRIYLESAPDGWLYSARIPNRRRVLAYFTDGDLCDARLRSAANFEDYVAQYFSSECEGPMARITASSPALSASMQPVRDWFGLMARDGSPPATPRNPSTHSPRKASSLPLSAVTMRPPLWLLFIHRTGACWKNCRRDLDARYAAYLIERLTYYRAEQRWVARPFWQRRHRTFDREPSVPCRPVGPA